MGLSGRWNLRPWECTNGLKLVLRGVLGYENDEQGVSKINHLGDVDQNRTQKFEFSSSACKDFFPERSLSTLV